MFTENEFSRIKSFKNQIEKLETTHRNIANRVWSGRHTQAKENEYRHRLSLLSNQIMRLYTKQLNYANTLRHKYGMRVHSITRPNLNNVIRTRKHQTARSSSRSIFRTTVLPPNVFNLIIPSPRQLRFGTRVFDPWTR
jgi:hypothetical protein